MTTSLTDTSGDLPRFHELFTPVLHELDDADVLPARDVVQRVATRLNLTAEQRARTIPSGQGQLTNRVTWALSHLFQAQAVEKPSRGHFRITDRGRQLLSAHPDRFGVDELRAFPEFQAFQARSKSPRAPRPVSPVTPAAPDETPLEQASTAVEELNAEVAAELVQRIHQAPPEFLEKAVLRLLVAMGYGGNDSAAMHLGGSGDGGFDGVINQDALGISRVYIQAKRYKPDSAIGRPDIQGFLGALHHAGAAGGVFITTSRFTRDAETFATASTPRVILIDGTRLGQLMVTHRIGVQERQVFHVVETDEDFFEQD